MVSIKYWWNINHDPTTCDKCGECEGYEWIFLEEMPPPILVHPKWGAMWDLEADHSLAHTNPPRRSGVCRCWLDWEIDDSDLEVRIAQLNNEMERLDLDFKEVVDILDAFMEALK